MTRLAPGTANEVRSVGAGTMDRLLRSSFVQVYTSLAQHMCQCDRETRCLEDIAAGNGRLQTTIKQHLLSDDEGQLKCSDALMRSGTGLN